MAGVVQQGVFGATGVFWRLPRENQDRILKDNGNGTYTEVTSIWVLERPEPWHIQALAGEGIKLDAKSDRLLGLWTRSRSGASRIDLFAADITAHNADPVDVAIHEIGHAAFDQPDYYDHDHATGFLAPDASNLAVLTNPNEGWDDSGCPFCRLDTHLADVQSNLDGLRQRAHLQHRIPPGLGGRLPEARRKLQAAVIDLQETTALMPDRAGQARMIGEQIQATITALSSEQMTPEDVSRAYVLAYKAWDSSYDYGHIWQLRKAGVM